MPQKCHVINCNYPAIAKDLCNTHYKRVWRHGSADVGRPNDWGNREKHPMYRTWCGLRRYHYLDMDQSWKEDFWAFVKDVPEKNGTSKACRPDKSKPWSKKNFYWKENRSNAEDRKQYMREWQRKSRAANRNYYLDIDIRKKYGVTLQWYEETFSRQNGVCAICKQPESSVIKGKVIAMPIDHDHNTGKVRGLLCTKCNRGIGLFRDDINLLKSAIEYLQKASE